VENKVTNWANPTPAGLVALAVACFCFFAMLNSNITGVAVPGLLPLLGCILLGGFVVQLVVALLDLKSGALPGGNTFLFFSAYFMLASGLEMFVKYFAATGMWPVAADSTIDGWLWACLGIAIILWTPAFFKSPAILFVMVVLLDFAVPLVALNDFGIAKTFCGPAAGWVLLVIGCLGLYLSAALLVNGTYGKTVFPNPGPLYKEKNKG
jgi:succinate-acetate transporter protein